MVKEFDYNIGLRQGCVLSVLCNIFIDEVLTELNESRRQVPKLFFMTDLAVGADPVLVF